MHISQNLPSTLEELRNRVQSQGSASSSANSAPFYLNGWRAFSEHPELAGDAKKTPLSHLATGIRSLVTIEAAQLPDLKMTCESHEVALRK